MRKWGAGSYTLEAAIIVSLIMTLILSFIEVSFYLHDRVILYEAMVYTADKAEKLAAEPVDIYGKLEFDRLYQQSVLRTKDFRDDLDTELLRTVFMEKTGSGLLMSEVNSISIEVTNREIKVVWSAEFDGIGTQLFQIFFPESSGFSGEYSLDKGMDPEELIRLVRGITGGRQ